MKFFISINQIEIRFIEEKQKDTVLKQKRLEFKDLYVNFSKSNIEFLKIFLNFQGTINYMKNTRFFNKGYITFPVSDI